MIAALLLRFGIPKWAAILALCTLAATSALAYRHQLIQQGVSLEASRRDKIDAENTVAANQALLALNARLKAAQAALAAAQLDLEKLQQENDREKLVSSQRQSDLLAGRERLSVLTRAHPRDSAQAGPPAGAAAPTVDPGTGVVYDLDPAAAAGLEGIREQHNEAVRRLDACILAYDVVKAAADAP